MAALEQQLQQIAKGKNMRRRRTMIDKTLHQQNNLTNPFNS
jgi:hypothetical protein